MNNLTDVTKHLFYSAWILVSIEMIRVGGVIITSFELLLPIADIAFDCALILFGIGILRLGYSLDYKSKWLVAPILFFISAFLDVTSVIIHLTNFEASWQTEPLVYLNLTIVVVQTIILVIGFLFLKLNIDYLAENNIIERKGQYYLTVGFLLNLIPSIIGWYEDFTGDLSYLNLALILYIIAVFFILLGFLGLTSTMTLLQKWSHEQEPEPETLEVEE